MLHGYASFWVENSRPDEGGNTRGAQGQVSIDYGVVSVGSITKAGSRVKWWPEHPQENSSDHGENIGMVFGALKHYIILCVEKLIGSIFVSKNGAIVNWIIFCRKMVR